MQRRDYRKLLLFWSAMTCMLGLIVMLNAHLRDLHRGVELTFYKLTEVNIGKIKPMGRVSYSLALLARALESNQF